MLDIKFEEKLKESLKGLNYYHREEIIITFNCDGSISIEEYDDTDINKRIEDLKEELKNRDEEIDTLEKLNNNLINQIEEMENEYE